MKPIQSILTLLVFAFLSACVTINVYFPAAAAQEAAREIVDDVLKQERSDSSKPPQARQTDAQNSSIVLKSWSLALLDFVISPAHAQANININTPAIAALRSKLKAQHQQLRAFFDSRHIGYDDQGLVRIRTSEGLNIRTKATLKKKVNTINTTLNQLYREIAHANGQPQWLSQIKKTFARTWIAQMKKGWMYYQSGQWKTK